MVPRHPFGGAPVRVDRAFGRGRNAGGRAAVKIQKLRVGESGLLAGPGVEHPREPDVPLLANEAAGEDAGQLLVEHDGRDKGEEPLAAAADVAEVQAIGLQVMRVMNR